MQIYTMHPKTRTLAHTVGFTAPAQAHMNVYRQRSHIHIFLVKEENRILKERNIEGEGRETNRSYLHGNKILLSEWIIVYDGDVNDNYRQIASIAQIIANRFFQNFCRIRIKRKMNLSL